MGVVVARVGAYVGVRAFVRAIVFYALHAYAILYCLVLSLMPAWGDLGQAGLGMAIALGTTAMGSTILTLPMVGILAPQGVVGALTMGSAGLAAGALCGVRLQRSIAAQGAGCLCAAVRRFHGNTSLDLTLARCRPWLVRFFWLSPVLSGILTSRTGMLDQLGLKKTAHAMQQTYQFVPTENTKPENDVFSRSNPKFSISKRPSEP